jgi:general secretion pathway protein A
MYKEFFGLQALPFNLTPDPAFLFLPPKHREAVTGLTYAIVERKGFVVLTGDAGTGKTTLLNAVLSRMPETHVLTSVVLNPTLTPAEFLENVLLDFGIPNVPDSKAKRLWVLQDFLARAYQENHIVAIIIDEAHKLSPEVLEEIRLLGNYEFGPDKFLQILMLGQCELDDVLNRYDLRQLKQRIALRLYIDPLTAGQTDEYIAFRWMTAGGGNSSPFAQDAIREIIRWSRGIPRVINSLCDTALLMAYAEGVRAVTAASIRVAAANLMLLETTSEMVVSPELTHLSPALSPPLTESVRTPPAAPDARSEPDVPIFSHYGGRRSNSSLLRRIADRFGIPR